MIINMYLETDDIKRIIKEKIEESHNCKINLDDISIEQDGWSGIIARVNANTSRNFDDE